MIFFECTIFFVNILLFTMSYRHITSDILLQHRRYVKFESVYFCSLEGSVGKVTTPIANVLKGEITELER